MGVHIIGVLKNIISRINSNPGKRSVPMGHKCLSRIFSIEYSVGTILNANGIPFIQPSHFLHTLYCHPLLQEDRVQCNDARLAQMKSWACVHEWIHNVEDFPATPEQTMCNLRKIGIKSL